MNYNIDFNKDIKGFNKLSSNQKFFVSNFIKLAQELYNQGENTLMDLLKKQDNNAKTLLNFIANVMLKYNINNEKMNLNKVDKVILQQKLYNQVDKIIDTEKEEEAADITTLLNNQISDKYNINNYLLSFSTSFKLAKLKEKDLKKIINYTIKGKNFSDRIYDNKKSIEKLLKKDIFNFLNGNISVNEIHQEIKKKFNINKMCTTRLVRNEVARVQNEANEQFFKDKEGTYLLYTATLDKHTCKTCAEYDGKVFKVDEDRPKLPLHVNDRCTYVLLPNKDYKPSRRRINNKKDENINYKTYKEWEKEAI